MVRIRIGFVRIGLSARKFSDPQHRTLQVSWTFNYLALLFAVIIDTVTMTCHPGLLFPAIVRSALSTLDAGSRRRWPHTPPASTTLQTSRTDDAPLPTTHTLVPSSFWQPGTGDCTSAAPGRSETPPASTTP